jgi:hypothetical protein
MARMTLLVAGVVVVLFCFLEIHAVIIAQRDDKSSCTLSTLTLTASLNLIYLHSLNKY